MGPQNFVRTEKVALVSRRKEIDLPDTVMNTQDSLSEMAVVWPRDTRPHQSSIARPRRLAGGQSGLHIRVSLV